MEEGKEVVEEVKVENWEEDCSASSSVDTRQGSNIYAAGDDGEALDALIMQRTSEGRQGLQPGE